MKLSVSNIAWNNNELESHLKLLKDLGCDGVEIAPSCIWQEPVNASEDEVESVKKLVKKYELEISAFHALLFTRPDLYLFGDESIRNEGVSYLKKLIKLAGDLSVKVLVYGSPKSRKVGNNSYDQCYNIAIDVFSKLAEESKAYNTCLCIEPLGPANSDFIQTADEGYKLLKDVNSPCFGLHLDAGAMAEVGEDFGTVFPKYGDVMRHFHVNNPGLLPPGCTDNFDHSIIGASLQASAYNGFVSIEMRRGYGDSMEVIRNAVTYVRRNYFSG